MDENLIKFRFSSEIERFILNLSVALFTPSKPLQINPDCEDFSDRDYEKPDFDCRPIGKMNTCGRVMFVELS